MDFIIVYERKQRELENAVLLKIELEKRGFSCGVFQYYEAFRFNLLNINPPKIILVPHLYNTRNINRTFSRFGRSNHLVNLQYEQVLSEKWEKLGHHNPKGEAKKAHHICWGQKTKNRLINAGIQEENIKVLGALHLDLLREEYRINQKKKREEYAKQFNLDPQKDWVLFLSSFTYAEITDKRLKLNEMVAGTSLSSFREIHTKSRNKLIVWFSKILEKDKENIFIYRPHPDELSLDPIVSLEKKYDNFKIIREYAVKNWIELSDRIYSWYSTSVVEAHFLDKPYSILRPEVLPDNFDSVLLRHASFITTYEDFEKDYFIEKKIRFKAIENNYIFSYYENDDNFPAFMKYCNFLENLLNKKKSEFNLKTIDSIKGKILSFFVLFVYTLYSLLNINLDKYKSNIVKRNFFIEWFIEFDNQIASDQEKQEIENRIKKIIGKKC